jgi:N-acetylglutamate synthase-like GNAT family acetyltransferase
MPNALCAWRRAKIYTVKVLENSRDHLSDFVRLNEQWISTYFAIEDVDRKLAENPGQIIDAGGYIFTVIESEEVVGVCALFLEEPGVFEVARMAVPPEQQGKGYGNVLMDACLNKLGEVSATKAFIVSNTSLKAAVSLYKKHGFKTAMLGQHPEYSRGNIVLERHVF